LSLLSYVYEFDNTREEDRMSFLQSHLHDSLIGHVTLQYVYLNLLSLNDGACL